MSVNKNFIVKNGLEVAGDLIFANDATNNIGIGTTNVLYTMHVVGGIGATALNVTGVSTLASDVTIGGNLQVASNLQSTTATINALSLPGTVSVGASSYSGLDGQYLKSTGTGVAWENFPVGRTSFNFTATPGQTVFNASYNVGLVDIFINGVKLTPVEFTADDAVSIILAEPCFGGESVDILAYAIQGLGAGNTGITGLTIQDEGVIVGNPVNVTSLNFTGAAVTAVGSGAGVTVTVFGGGGPGEGLFALTDVGIHTLANVGLGTTNPTGSLSVRGSGIDANQIFASGISTFTGIDVPATSTLSIGSSGNPASDAIHIYTGVSPTDYFRMYGSGNNLYLRHAGAYANDIIVNAKNSVTIGGGGTTSYSIFANSDGSAGLAYTGAEKLRTLGTGVTVTGELSVSGRIVGAATSNIIPFLFGDYSDLPNASDYHGAFVHVHNAQKGFFAHGGQWIELVNVSNNVVGTGTETYNIGGLNAGIVTATSFTGDGSNLTGLTTSQITDYGSGLAGGYSDSSVNAHLNISSASPGEVLGWTGLDYDWVAQSGGSGTGYFSDDQINPGIHTTAAHFGIGTTDPITSVQVNDVYGVETARGDFTAVAGVARTSDSYATSTFRNAEYTLYFEHSTGIQSQKVLVMDNGTTAYSQEYGIMYSSDLLVSVGATVKGSNVEIWWTPETGVNGNINYSYVRETMI